MSTVRPRSISRSRITVIDPGDPDNECLDPNQLLESLLKQIRSLDVPLVVCISDESTRVEYPLKVFTSKLWPIRGNHVIFGLQRINFKQIKASITYDVEIEKGDNNMDDE